MSNKKAKVHNFYEENLLGAIVDIYNEMQKIEGNNKELKCVFSKKFIDKMYCESFVMFEILHAFTKVAEEKKIIFDEKKFLLTYKRFVEWYLGGGCDSEVVFDMVSGYVSVVKYMKLCMSL